MKFSIQEEGGEKQFFLSFQDAEEKTGINDQTILRIIRSPRNYFKRRSDKKIIFIQEEYDGPFIQIDGKNFYDFEEISEQFGLKRQVFYKQLLKKGGKYFIDGNGEIHKVTAKSELLERLISDSHQLEMYKQLAAYKKRCKNRLNGDLEDAALKEY